MTLGYDLGKTGSQLFIKQPTTTFFSYTDTFAYLVDLHSQSLVANNSPSGSTTFYLVVLGPDGNGGMTPLNKLEQDLTGPGSQSATGCGLTLNMIDLLPQEPAGQYEVQFITADGTKHLAQAIFDYYDESEAG